MTISNENNLKTKTNSNLSRKQRRVRHTRQKILNAAKKLFETNPYEDVKMDDIAEHADLGRATIYYQFGSKENIYFEIGIQSFREVSERQQEIMFSESTGLDQILKLSEDTLRGLFENPLIPVIMRHYLVLNSNAEIPADEALKKMELGEEIEDSSTIIRARYLQELRKFEKPWKITMERGFEDGSIQQDLNLDQTLHFIFMIISGIVDRAHLERIPLQKMNLTTDQLITRTIDLIRKDLTMR